MKWQKKFGILFVMVAIAIMYTLPLSAACAPADVGTGGNDTLTCNAAFPPAANVVGLNGLDLITIDAAVNAPGFTFSGDASPISGNDTIISSGITSFLIGDQDTNGGASGNDHIYLMQNGGVSGAGIVGDMNLNGTSGGDGGDDFIVTEKGTFVDDSIWGDMVEDDGGNDTLLIHGFVGQSIFGDYMTTSTTGFIQQGGNDSIDFAGTMNPSGFIAGDFNVTPTSATGGDDTIEVSGVAGEIMGDYLDNGTSGNDSVLVTGTGSTSNIWGDFVADRGGAEGGDDTIVILNGGVVIGDIAGDGIFSDGIALNADGGNDSIQVGGAVSGHVYGDFNDDGDGGADTIAVLSSGAVGGDVAGDELADVNAVGGRDSIDVYGTVSGSVSGDDLDFTGRSGRDTIVIHENATVSASVSGDRTKKAGSKDTIRIDGNVSKSVFGDNVNRAGGDDAIVVGTDGTVGANVLGDYAKQDGGDDNIIVRGQVGKNVSGDSFRPGAVANGGDDTIKIKHDGFVQKDVLGDDGLGDGGADSIIVEGTVNGDVIGDGVSGAGGIDTIRVRSTGVVQGDVVGDAAGTPANAGSGGDDVFAISGTVNGTVYLDNVGGPTLDIAGDLAAIDLAVGGNDVIYVAGQINGNISSAIGNDGDDVFVIADGGVVGGIMDAGAHVDGDSLVFDLSTKSKGEFGKLSELFNDLTIEEGGVSYRGNAYRWVNFEFLQYAIQLFQTRTVPLYCSGIYEKNAEGTACVRKGQEEYDAIMFHRNNPGYDGRLPGTEACAIYNYGNAMRVYEVVNGSEGELVTTISADVFSHAVGSNLLLARSASGNVHVYYLTSHEVQVECIDWTGKTQVRIIPDFSGTVNASFDKVGG